MTVVDVALAPDGGAQPAPCIADCTAAAAACLLPDAAAYDVYVAGWLLRTSTRPTLNLLLLPA
jgi:hypothetical protein